MTYDWRNRMTCICGWSTTNAMAEAKHRHNFPALCKPAKKPKPSVKPKP